MAGTRIPPTIQRGALTLLLEDVARLSVAGSSSDSEARPQPGTMLGRFRLERAIGRGSFGIVFEATDTTLGRRVALKLMRARAQTRVPPSSLIDEAEAAARLSHSNIVQLHDLGTSAWGPYLVMELLEGASLADVLAGGPLKASEAVRIARAIASGLTHAHYHGVVHRDVKPGNAFVCSDAEVKILDFGLATILGHSSVEGGTPEYMAPEVLAGRPANSAADVFSLGVIIHEMLSGDRPGAEAGSYRRGMQGRTIGSVTVPASLRKLLGSMLAHAPSERPTALQVRDHLARIQLRMRLVLPIVAAWSVAGVALALAVVLGLRSQGGSSELTAGRFADGAATSAAFSALMAGVVSYLWRSTQRSHLLLWSLYWWLYLFVWVLDLFSLQIAGPVPPILDFTLRLSAVGARAFFVLGVVRYLGWSEPSPRMIGAVTVLMVVAAAIGTRLSPIWTLGALPRWESLPFQTYFQGLLLLGPLAYLVIRGTSGRVGAVLGLSVIAFALSDAWDVVADLLGASPWRGSARALFLSNLITHVTDALAGVGQLAAAFGEDRLER